MNAKFARNGIVMLVLVVGTLVLLYQLLGQSSQPNSTAYSQFLAYVQGGKVASVTQEQSTLTVTPTDPTAATYTVTVPPILTNVYQDMQAAAKAGNVTLPQGVFTAKDAPDTSWIGLLLTGLPAAARDRRLHLLHDAPGPGHQQPGHVASARAGPGCSWATRPS